MFNKEKTKVINLGCRLNFFESEIINGILSDKKHEKKIVVNTCAVTNNAVQKSLQEVRKLAKYHPDKEIIVTGCASQLEKGLFENLKNDTDKLAGKVTSFSGINVRGIDTTYKEYYKNGLQNIVSNIYKKDLELFNYEF